MDVDRHLRLSLGLIAVFTAMGLWLEAMFGLRAEGWVDDPLRREFLRLGHAHGAALGILNVALAWAMRRLKTPDGWARRIRLAAWLGAIAVGVGFVGGGIWHGATDPGPLVLCVPAGAMMVIAATLAVAWVRADDAPARRNQPEPKPKPGSDS
jgi:peptidoglycan/LPS O-acetylase OafA/YrhL